MRTVTLEVKGLEEALSAFRNVWNSGQAEDEARISFSSPELLWKVLTAKRWEMLKALAGSESMSARELARQVNRDVRAVNTDLQALIVAGIVQRTKEGQVIFPYDAVHVDFMLIAS